MIGNLILGVAIGAVIGILITILFNKLTADGDETEKLRKLQAEHDQYRKKVDNHFVNSSVLFKGLTEQYRDVYRHIADGAGELCSEEAKAIQVGMDEPGLLAQQTTESADTVTAESEVASGEKPVTNNDIDDDDIPLASEVEMTPEIADEIKNNSLHK